MSDTAAPPPVPLVADRLADFSDRLSPMLVKELRQGLRARTFVAVFLSLQILLALVLLSAAGTSSPQGAGRVISSVIFLFFGLAVLVVQPLRGVGALHAEIKANSLEMIVLTRLSAWRIVLGKWVALAAQSALLLAAIFPYLILRYWFGEMNLFGELMLLLLVFVASCVATGITIGLSAVPSMLIRGLLPLGGAILLCFMTFGVAFSDLPEAAASVSLADSDSRWGVLLFLISAVYLTWTFLGLATSGIAPAAENHATLRRFASLALLVIAAVIGIIVKPDDELVLLLACLFAVPAIMMALTEPFHLLPPTCRPFLRFGVLGRIAGRFLYPGWPSGTLFSLVIAAIAVAFLYLAQAYPMTNDEQTACVAIFSGLFMPSALMGFFSSRIRHRFPTYLLIAIVALILGLLMILVAEAGSGGNKDFLWLFCWVPVVQLALSGTSADGDATLAMSVVILGIYALLSTIHALRQLPAIARAEGEAVAAPHAPETPATPPASE